MRIWFILLALAAFSLNAMAQRPDFGTAKNPKDSLNRVRDSISSKPFVPKASVTKVYHPDSLHSPHKAFIRSAIVPGWGQVYNHKWWKVPLIYGGFATFTYYLILNNNDYHKYVKEGNLRFQGLPGSEEFKNVSGGYQQFYDVASGSQRNFQLCILGILGVWGINCVDAYIDAKFIHSYSVDNNLSIRVAPSLLNQPQPMYASNFNGYIPGVKVTLGF